MEEEVVPFFIMMFSLAIGVGMLLGYWISSIFEKKNGALLKRVMDENEELRQAFDAVIEANRRGTTAWQEKTGRKLEWPDQARMVEWLADELEEARAETEAVRRKVEGLEMLRPVWANYNAEPQVLAGAVAGLWQILGVDNQTAAMQAIENLRTLAAELVEGLREARDDVESWGAYASDYFTEKHDLAGDLARIDAILARARALGIGEKVNG